MIDECWWDTRSIASSRLPSSRGSRDTLARLCLHYPPPPSSFQLRTACFAPCSSSQCFPLVLWAEMDAPGSDVCIRSSRDETTLPSSLLSFLQPSSVHPSTSIHLFPPHPHLPQSQFTSLTGFLKVPENWLQQPPVGNLLIHIIFRSSDHPALQKCTKLIFNNSVSNDLSKLNSPCPRLQVGHIRFNVLY